METEIRQSLQNKLADGLTQMGLPVQGNDWETAALLALVASVLALVGYQVFKRAASKGVETLAYTIPGPWSAPVKQHRIVEKVARILPLVLLDLFTSMVFAAYPGWDRLVTFVLEVGILLAVVRLLYAVADTAHDVALRSTLARRLPVQSLVQVAKLLLFIVAAILLVSMLLGKSPVYLLSGLGVAAGLIMLVFQDAILGFVAGIQLSANRMVSPGDWIQMDKYGADGDVIEVSLTTVKVQNWDKTISMIPARALVADSFRNWRGMQESGGRRIKRALLIDLHSVRFLDAELEQRLGSINLLAPHLVSKEAELSAYNAPLPHQEQPANGRRLTNVGCFRAYLQRYLNEHPQIHKEMTLMVRQLAPTDSGLPLEIYCFTNDTRWPVYEGIQADIFDHALAVLPQFELRAMQQPTGADLRALQRAN
ncbi:miniconductance mechanosensitive channel [Ferrimonas marina]|uniref:Miniconductance mechanosensitive channel n=1 Tax=Ferrimonas marina TaxID=299255 RepID=A0A1M5XNG4_9GAMM|nr:miniconductance mechanosensitive channel [Ferrimonas marina]